MYFRKSRDKLSANQSSRFASPLADSECLEGSTKSEYSITRSSVRRGVIGQRLVSFQLWRHGARTPGGSIPTDTTNTASSWREGLLELTAVRVIP